MAKRPCARPGCGALVVSGYCAAHQSMSARARTEATRPSACKRGYGRAWAKASAAFLRAHPLCVDPDGRHPGRYVAATETDHIVPHKGDSVLFWDSKNWQGLCHDCHSAKTAKEDGGFGRATRG